MISLGCGGLVHTKWQGELQFVFSGGTGETKQWINILKWSQILSFRVFFQEELSKVNSLLPTRKKEPVRGSCVYLLKEITSLMSRSHKKQDTNIYSISFPGSDNTMLLIHLPHSVYISAFHCFLTKTLSWTILGIISPIMKFQ